MIRQIPGALALVLAVTALPAFAAGGVKAPYSFKPDPGNQASLQRGARSYMDYCAGCHSLKYLRYNRLGRDLGIPDDLLEAYLMPAGAKPGDTIQTAMPEASASWFGLAPPDLSLTSRHRGPDWVYSYLLTFYLDPSRPTGVDNLMLPGASMPHVLGHLQGWQQRAGGGSGGSMPKFELVQPGALSPQEYRAFVGDLTNFMVYAAEPGRNDRVALGWKVLAFIVLFWGLAVLLKREYWKDVH
jgi:ubiquinol-cytochrome c reductase cytochrome c1 subunit